MRRSGSVVALTIASAAMLLASTAAAAPVSSTGHPGPITVSGRETLAHSITRAINKYGPLLVTEAPDGAVFYVSGTTVYGVANGTESVAAQVATTVLALAASSTTVVVETADSVIAYNRTDGSQAASWPNQLEGQVEPALATAGGIVWSLTDDATDESGAEPGMLHELQVGQPPKTVSSNAAAGWLTVDPAGDAYFDLFTGKIERVTPAGAVTRSTMKQFSDSALDFVNGKLAAEIDGEHPVDVVLNPTTLAVEAKQPSHLGDYFGLAGTTIGLLALVDGCGSQKHCTKEAVTRITLPDHRGAKLVVAGAAAVLGPQPVVVTVPSSGSAALVTLK